MILSRPPTRVAPVTDLNYIGGPPAKKDAAGKDEPKKDDVKKDEKGEGKKDEAKKGEGRKDGQPRTDRGIPAGLRRRYRVPEGRGRRVHGQ